MPELEELKMIELIRKFIEDINKIQETRSTKLFKEANTDLQNIYGYHVANDKIFRAVQMHLKNLYASYNYAAGLVNEAIKRKFMDPKNAETIDECLEVMLKCCTLTISALKLKKQ